VERGSFGERLATRLARAALRLSPRSFRGSFGDDLLDVFAERFREVRRRGLVAAAGLVVRTMLDLITTAALERAGAGRRTRAARGGARTRETRRMDRLLQDLGFAWRVLRKSPAHTVAAVLTMALGIGANVAIFSFVDALLLRPAPGVAGADRVVTLFTAEGGRLGVSSYLDVQDLDAGMTTLSSLAAFKPLSMDLSTRETTERVEGMLVESSYFRALGVEPVAGRFFLDEEDRPPAQSTVAVLGWGLWQRRFAGSEEVLGAEVRLNGRVFTVVGITPAGFRGTYLGSRPELFVPMAMQPHFMPTSGYLLDRRGWGGVVGVGRLRDGVTLEQASAELATHGARLRAEYRESAEREYVFAPLRRGNLMPDMRSQAVALSALLLGVVALVLLAACANVANLLLSRSAARQRELAVRRALGAGRPRLMAQLLTESLLLALFGGAAGVGLALFAFPAMRRLPLPFVLDVTIDARVLFFAAAVTVLSALLFGLLPAYRSTRTVPASDLRGGGAAPTRPRLAGALVATQIAVSMLLAILAGLLGRTLAQLAATDVGFRHQDVALATIDPALQGYQGTATAAFYQQLVERLRARPGVSSAGLASVLPGSEDRDVAGFFPPGQAVQARRMGMQFCVVDAGYFETLGIGLREGRLLQESDGASSPPVVLLNESAAALVARSLERPALGSSLWTGGDDEPVLEVVGVVADSKTGPLREPPAPMVYFSLPQAAAADTVSRLTVVARWANEPAELLPAIRAVVRELDPNVPVVASGTLETHLSGSLIRERLSAGVLASSALLTLLLASVGLYGVLGTAVSRRTAELGLRMALGARAGNLVRMVVGQGLALYGIGLVVGVAGAALASRMVGSQLYGVRAFDPATYLAAAFALAAVTTLASYLPARRATRIDPVRALRQE
jgi:predicted permease